MTPQLQIPQITRCLISLLGWVLLACIACPVMAGEKQWQISLDEKQLKEGGVDQSTDSLMAYLRRHALSRDARQKLLHTVNQLGHTSWEMREEATTRLIDAGRPALHFVRAALTEEDQEVSRRAKFIETKIASLPHGETMKSVVRTLANRGAHQAVPLLLRYLPWISDDHEVQVIHEALAKLGLKDHKPLDCIVTGARAEEVEIRAACAMVLGKGLPQSRSLLQPLLKDKEPAPRFQAARALLHAGDRAAVPIMIDLINQAKAQDCWQVEDVLFQVAQDAKQAPSSLQRFDAAARAKAVVRWKTWWKANGAGVDLTKIDFDQPVRGYTLYCEYDGGPHDGCVWLAGRDGKTRWEITGLVGPNDAQLLSNGRVLVAERNAGRVTERDLKGNILWEKQVTGGAIACQRLNNGHTLITSWVSVILVDRAGREVWKFDHTRGMRYARQVRDRRILGVAANGEVFFLSEKGQLLQTIHPEKHTQGAGYWASVELLANNHVLVALGSAEKVIEIDQKGKIVWEANVPNAVYATRLRDGHTLVCNFEERVVIKLDRTGKEVSRQLLRGRPFVVRRY